MNWKSISKGLVIFCIGFIIGWFVGWNPTTESMRGALISGSLIVLASLTVLYGGSDILGAINNYFKGKKEAKLSHAKRDIKPELDIMIESIPSFNDDMKLYIKSNKMPIDYEQETEQHLDNYEEVCSHKKKRDKCIEKYNENIQLFLEETSRKIINTLEQKSPLIIKWSKLAWGERISPMRPNDPKIIFKEVIKIIRPHLYSPSEYPLHKTEGEIDSHWLVKLEGNQWVLYADIFAIESRTETEIIEIKQAIDTVLKEVSTGKEFNNIRKYYNTVINNHELFVDAIIA